MNLDCNQPIQVTNRKSSLTSPRIQPPRPGTGNGQNGDCDDANSLLDARNQETPRDLLELIWLVTPRIMCVGVPTPRNGQTCSQPKPSSSRRWSNLSGGTYFVIVVMLPRVRSGCCYRPDGPRRSKTPEVNLLVLIPTLNILGAVWIAGHLPPGIDAVHIVNECHERPIVGIEVFEKTHRE